MPGNVLTNSPEPKNPDVAPWRGTDGRVIVLTLAALAVLVYLLRFVLLPFVVAGVIAYICTPLVDWLTRRARLPRALLAVAVFVALIGAAALTVAVAGRRLVTEAASAVTDLQATLDRLLQQTGGELRVFGHTIDAAAVAHALTARIHDAFSQPDFFPLATVYAFAAMIGTFLTVVLLCYFLVSGKSVARGLLWLVPPGRRDLVVEIGRRLDPVLKRYFLGILVIVIYAIVAAYIGLGHILGIDHPLLLAVLTGTLETVPIIGSTAAAVIAGLVSLHTATGLTSILAFALYAVLLRLSIDQIVAPLVLGGAASVHPVLIIFCFLAGAVLLGIPGVILAVPAALTVKATLETLYGDDGR